MMSLATYQYIQSSHNIESFGHKHAEAVIFVSQL